MEAGVTANNQSIDEVELSRRRFEFEPSRRRLKASPSYSRFVGMMKLLLPVLGLGLVVTLVIWPSEFQKATGFHLGTVSSDVDSGADLTMLRPRYLGTDARSQPFVVTADSATQDPADQRLITLIRLQADMSMTDGRWFTVMADNGVYHQQKQFLRLNGAVNFFSDQGYEINAKFVEINLKSGKASSSFPVNGQGPFGTIRANSLRIEEFGEKLLLLGNVKMQILPPGEG